MASEAQIKSSTSSKKSSFTSLNSPLETPVKGAPVGEQVGTPEKPLPLPRQARNRSIAFSVKEVRRVALGLQSCTVRPYLDQSDADLSSVEEQLGASSGSSSSPKSSKPKTFIKLPQKYEVLCEFFNCMESSIRLLRLKGIMCTFSNICTSIQHLSERRFTYAHLAQLKYIMPEAILIKKLLVLDEATCCMKPELQVMLHVDALAKSIRGKRESGYSILRSLFRQRIVNFFKDHPEEDEVPEDQLPHPFSQANPSTCPSLDINAAQKCSESSSNGARHQQILVPSHMPQSFLRRFSRKLPVSNSEKTPLLCFSEASPNHDLSVHVAPSVKCTSKPRTFEKTMLASPVSTTILGKSNCEEENYEELTRAVNNSHNQPNDQEATPAKAVFSPLGLMIRTPEIFSPKRCRTSPTSDSPVLIKSVKQSTRKKLFMTPKKNARAGYEEVEVECLSPNDDPLDILPETLVQSIREKEMNAAKEKEESVSNAIKRQKLIASLPNVFDMILLAFQSWKRSVVTKQELIQKLISSNCKIVDRREVEEQLKLLLDLVPDWISEKIACSGDIICCDSSKAIRSRLKKCTLKVVEYVGIVPRIMTESEHFSERFE